MSDTSKAILPEFEPGDQAAMWFWRHGWQELASDGGTRRKATVGRNWHLMAGHGAKIARKQEEAIAALLSQRNIEDAARVAGVGTRTLLRWMKVPEFQTAYREARRAAFGQSIARLQQASSAAVSTLLKVMIDPNTPASSRVRAADSVLGHTAKAIELEEVEARVAALEAATRGK